MTESVPTMQEASVEMLECARYGEADDLVACLNFGVDVNFKDIGGNTALHKGKTNFIQYVNYQMFS